MNRIRETVKGRIAGVRPTPLEDEIRKYVLREFASKGRPPTPGDIMKALGLSSVDIVIESIENLQKADILQRREDEIISAYPFSALETRHKVTFEDGHEVYALCAIDALGIHFMLDKDINIVSKCPQCGRGMRIVVKHGQIDSCDPEGIIEFVSNKEIGGCSAQSLCPFINFFCSKEHLEEWREGNPEYKNGKTYSLTAALEQGKTIFGDLLK